MATSLWGSKDGVLNQIKGVGARTTEMLLKSNVISFEDVCAKSSNEIEQLTNRKQPFGQELRASVAKILRNYLIIRAHIERDEPSGSSFVVCKVERNYPVDSNSSYDQNICWYTLAVYSDQSNGSILMFRENLSNEGEHRISSPNVFGKIHVHLISSLVGLDTSVTLENEDSMSQVKAEVKSPVRNYFDVDKSDNKGVSSSKKKTNTNNKEVCKHIISGKRAQMAEHSSLVQNVQDFRVRSKSDFFKEQKLDRRSLTPTNKADTANNTQKFVTPSPYAQSKANGEETTSQRACDTSKKRSNMGYNEKASQDRNFSNTFTPNRMSKNATNNWQNQKQQVW